MYENIIIYYVLEPPRAPQRFFQIVKNRSKIDPKRAWEQNAINTDANELQNDEHAINTDANEPWEKSADPPVKRNLVPLSPSDSLSL